MNSTFSSDVMDNLYPALTQCFAIIICGYSAGRLNLISETEAKGINTFVGTFSLPSLIFISLAQLDLSKVNLLFLLSILIAKSIVFFCVMLVTLLVGRPVNFGRAGIFAIFCTQSNDFAIGYPIVAALYKHTHPDYVSYLYLMAPISLAILNPISFVFMELGKRRQNLNLNFNGNDKKLFQLITDVTKNIIFNPIILMTVLGILGNFVFHHKIPPYLGDVLEVLGSAFSASALFLLGLRMVGKVHKLRGVTLVVPGILIIVKLIGLPLITREVISLLHAGYNTSETVDLSTYGFLYGTFPSAPTVFVFATQYSLDIDLIASAMVACTFISAPLMFVTAKMITITKTDPSEYIKQLDAFNLDISIVGLIACIWVIIVFTITKKICRLPHKITACLIVAQFMSCLGAILWNTLNRKQGWPGYIQFSLFTIGVYSTRLWTAILAVTLLFLQCHNLCYVIKLQFVFYIIGWVLPVILTVILLFFDKNTNLPFNKRNPNFVYGLSQAIIAVSLLVFCFIVTVGCLILHQRHQRRFTRYLDLANDITDVENESNTTNQIVQNKRNLPTINEDSLEENVGNLIEIDNDSRQSLNIGTTSPGGGTTSVKVDSIPVDGGTTSLGVGTTTLGGSSRSLDVGSTSMGGGTRALNAGGRPLACSTSNFDAIECCTEENAIDIEDIARKSPLINDRRKCEGCNAINNGERCEAIIRQYQEVIDDDLELIEEEEESHNPQILRHLVLLILLLCSMFVGMALSIWTLIMENLSGIYIELSFLDATLNFGQSIFVFGIFGLETKEILLPIIKIWRHLFYFNNKLQLPNELNFNTKLICEQFVKFHLDNCKLLLEKDLRINFHVYRNCFSGHRFVDWLIDVGLARDRIDAVLYARHLIDGRVLMHINEVYHFYDRNLLYKFV